MYVCLDEGTIVTEESFIYHDGNHTLKTIPDTKELKELNGKIDFFQSQIQDLKNVLEIWSLAQGYTHLADMITGREMIGVFYSGLKENARKHEEDLKQFPDSPDSPRSEMLKEIMLRFEKVKAWWQEYEKELETD